MGDLHRMIVEAVANERYLVSDRADERCEERGLTAWQLVTGLSDAELLEVRWDAVPNPTIVTRQLLVDGTAVEVVWAFLVSSRRALLPREQSTRTIGNGLRTGARIMNERRESRRKWVQRGPYAVELTVEVVYPAEAPNEPCLEPATVRFLDEVARRAEAGDVEYLNRVGRVYQAVTP